MRLVLASSSKGCSARVSIERSVWRGLRNDRDVPTNHKSSRDLGNWDISSPFYFYFIHLLHLLSLGKENLLPIYISPLSLHFLFLLLTFSSRKRGAIGRGGAEMTGFNGEGMVTKEEEASLGKKYGGIAPKKPLISKDNGRAFFDSADWALGKQATGIDQKTRTAVESLRPKLQPTPHQQLPPRRPTCKSGRDYMDD